MGPDGLLIIGYGSSLRSDDGAGRRAARLLSRCGFDAREVHQLTPELAEPIAASRMVIFLDAHAELPAGEVSMERVSWTGKPGVVLEHSASPAGLLRLAQLAYGAAPEAWLVGMGGESFAVGEGLTPAAEMAVARAVKEVIVCTNPV